MKILCVEYGSIDTDAIESDGGLRNGEVLVYRQGATPSFVLDMGDTDIRQAVYDRIKDNAKQEYDYGELVYKIPEKELRKIVFSIEVKDWTKGKQIKQLKEMK